MGPIETPEPSNCRMCPLLRKPGIDANFWLCRRVSVDFWYEAESQSRSRSSFLFCFFDDDDDEDAIAIDVVVTTTSATTTNAPRM